ncbi:MAG: TRAP transporter large permease subunit [Deltaproteobacteria bacterium]|nr:TRAP transporter large permease subunit [Deltaproteobacteria bacterium]
MASVVAPALIQLGLKPLAAHLFLFYFACISSITPPVALAAYAAAGVAGAGMLQVGLAAVRLGIIGFIVPFLFVYNPVLLFSGSSLEILFAFLTGSFGIIALGLGFERWLWGRLHGGFSLALIIASLLLIIPGWKTDLAGLVILLGVVAIRKRHQAGWREEEAQRKKALEEALAK